MGLTVTFRFSSYIRPSPNGKAPAAPPGMPTDRAAQRVDAPENTKE
jgi:hypothetical protein